jgi:L-rhamnose mutarotase
VPRVCFTLQVRPERLDEYRRRHAAVWPEMLRALRDAGWRDYQLFLRDDGLLVGTVVVDDLAAAQAAVDATEVSARWEAEMAPFFTTGSDGRAKAELELVFDLDEQLRALGEP